MGEQRIAAWLHPLRHWRSRRRRIVDASPRRVPLAWPSAVLLCVRHPDEHDALLEPFEDYGVGYPNIFGPPRFGPRCECGSLMYVAAARVVA